MPDRMPDERPYQRTHPWLDFQFDLRRLQPRDWLALGKATALCDQVAAAPLTPALAEHIHRIYLAKGALATTAIEGNTLSEEEARRAIAGTLDLPPSRAYLRREIDNVVAACNQVVAALKTDRRLPPLTVEALEATNALVLRGLEVEDHVVPGKVRTVNVSVAGYRCPEGRDARHAPQRRAVRGVGGAGGLLWATRRHALRRSRVAQVIVDTALFPRGRRQRVTLVVGHS